MALPSSILIATLMRGGGETGVQTHFRLLRDYLVAQGTEATIATPFMYSKWGTHPIFAVRKILDPLNGSASVWWYRFWHYLFLKQVLHARLREEHPIVVYAQCPLSALAALEARADASQKVVMVVHFNISEAEEWAGKGRISRGGWLFRRILALERTVLPRLDAIVYVSRFMKQIVEQMVPDVRVVRSAVIPNFGSRLDTAPPPDVHGDLVSIGTLEPRKNQAYLIRVLAAIKSRGRTYTLSLIGEGPDRGHLEALARQLGVADQIRFLGYRDRAAQLLPGHRAYVHGAMIENLSVTVIEALASGLPVFAAPVGGIPEMLSDGVEGVYWSLDDPLDGANKVIELLENEPRYARMRAAASARFRDQFDINVVARRLSQFLCET